MSAVMGWFRRNKLARGEAVAGRILRLHRADGTALEADARAALAIDFVRIGETYAMVDEGWWVIVGTDRVIAARRLSDGGRIAAR